MVRVKICGITNLRDAQAAQAAGADAVGFVFAPSPRRISEARAKQIASALGPWISKVGVFVNQRPAAVERVMKHCSLDAAQLHGDESLKTARTLRSKGIRVIKAVRIGSNSDLKAFRNYPADAFLLDTASPGVYGGTGKSFDWKVLKKIRFSKPVIVSGGLRPENVGRLLRQYIPYGVDVSSGVEKSPRKKNVKRISEFIKNAKKT